MAGDFKHRGVDAGGGDVLGNLPFRRSVRKHLRDEKHPRAVVGDEQVERDVPFLQPLARVAEKIGECLERGIFPFKAKASHRVSRRLVHHDPVPVPLLVHARRQPRGLRALDGKRFHEVIRLEVQVVDGGVRTERVVSNPEVRVPALRRHVQRRQ